MLEYFPKRPSHRRAFFHTDENIRRPRLHRRRTPAILMEVSLMNLDNRKEAQPTVQVSREITTTNGCKVTLTFAVKEDPNLQHDVAEMLLAAFIKRRSMLYEASALPVQSVHQRTGGQEG